jgi:eukaryotic-like serine/threonine-protein kinase
VAEGRDDLAETLAPGDISSSQRVTVRQRQRAEGEALGPGDMLGRYVVLARVGAGGMGEVYTAYDPELDRKIALKVIRPTDDDAPNATGRASGGRGRLIAEAKALAKLAHPNVVAVHDVGSYRDDVYIAMEYVEGITLTAWAVGERSWQEIVEVFAAAGRGLAAAHAEGIVHRDVKPDNILIGKDGRARMIDFGVAVATRRSSPDLAESALVGTPAYMAPEQFLGDELGPHTDQFSFGVALYEAAAG